MASVSSEGALYQPNLTCPVEPSSFSSSQARLAENPLDSVFIDSPNVVTARVEFTAADYESESQACGRSTPYCCYEDFLSPRCFNRKLILYPVYHMLIYSKIFLAGTF